MTVASAWMALGLFNGLIVVGSLMLRVGCRFRRKLEGCMPSVAEYELERKQFIEHGRQLTLEGEYYPVNQNHQKDLMLYRDRQRARVYRSGSCAGLCQCELVENPQGELVCPHTWRPCVSRKLSSVVSLLSKVNG